MTNALPLIPGQGLQGVYPPYDPNYEVLGLEGAVEFANNYATGKLIVGNPLVRVGRALPIEFSPAPELNSRKIYCYIWAVQQNGQTGSVRVAIDLYRPNVALPQTYNIVTPNPYTPYGESDISFFTGKGSAYNIQVSMQYSINAAPDTAMMDIAPFMIQTACEKLVLRYVDSSGWTYNTPPNPNCRIHYYLGIISSH